MEPFKRRGAHDGDGRDVLMREATQIVRHADRRIVELTITSTAEDLIIHFIKHTKAGSANRVTEAFEAAVNLTGYLAVGVIKPVEHILPGLAFLGM